MINWKDLDVTKQIFYRHSNFDKYKKAIDGITQGKFDFLGDGGGDKFSYFLNIHAFFFIMLNNIRLYKIC